MSAVGSYKKALLNLGILRGGTYRNLQFAPLTSRCNVFSKNERLEMGRNGGRQRIACC